MMQPECDGLTAFIEVAPAPPAPAPNPQLAGYWMWSLVFIAVAIFEAWAVWTHHRTLSQTVQHGPRWLQWAMGLGFLALLWHLFPNWWKFIL